MGKLTVAIIVGLLMIASVTAGRPVLGRSLPGPAYAAADSIPAARPAEKPQQAPDGKPLPVPVPVPEVIKEVPKSKRKIKPIAVPAKLPVKPIKVIRPGVIRRTIKVIG